MICQVHIIAERIKKNKDMTYNDILEWEILVRLDCPEMKACKLALNELLIKRDQYKKAMDNPTIQEQNHRAQKPKKKMWKFWR